MTQPTPELIANLHRDKLDRARRMSPEEKFTAGPRLFSYACQITLAGIRAQFPGIDEAAARAILRERLAWQRRREEQEIEDRGSRAQRH
jgi:hypothetical protein